LELPAKTAYALTYKSTDEAEAREGQLYFCLRRPITIFCLIFCTIAAAIPASKVSLLAFLPTFCCSWLGFAFAIFLFTLFAVYLAAKSIMTASKLNIACTTAIDATGISDTLWLVKFGYKWSQIHDVEMKNGNIYIVALVNGIHIPASAFASSDEAENFFALAKQFHALAQQKKKGISQDPFIADPDSVLDALYADEEAKWLEIEDKYKNHRESKAE